MYFNDHFSLKSYSFLFISCKNDGLDRRNGKNADRLRASGNAVSEQHQIFVPQQWLAVRTNIQGVFSEGVDRSVRLLSIFTTIPFITGACTELTSIVHLIQVAVVSSIHSDVKCKNVSNILSCRQPGESAGQMTSVQYIWLLLIKEREKICDDNFLPGCRKRSIDFKSNQSGRMKCCMDSAVELMNWEEFATSRFEKQQRVANPINLS